MSITTRLGRAFAKLRGGTASGNGRMPVPADVDWVYRLFLDRPPESRGIASSQANRHDSIESLCRTVMDSPEFRAKWRKGRNDSAEPNRPETEASASDCEVIRSFGEYSGLGTPGFVTDFLGTKTRVEFLDVLKGIDGRVEGFPFPGNFHASANEWAGTLRSVLDAKNEFVGVELGAGWGPWLAVCAAACERRGIRRVKLIGLEASAAHVEFLHRHFLDNGLHPELHTLLHGAAAAEDGFAEFPDLNHPSRDYGATLFAQDPLLQRVIGPNTTRVKAYSIPTLVAECEFVDLIHIDIQGSEAEVVTAARSTLRTKVKRLVIGTHGRAVEQQLLEVLSADGWLLETDHPCRYAPHVGGGLTLAADGCQVWRNGAF